MRTCAAIFTAIALSLSGAAVAYAEDEEPAPTAVIESGNEPREVGEAPSSGDEPAETGEPAESAGDPIENGEKAEDADEPRPAPELPSGEEEEAPAPEEEA